mmetsp:Transcript_39713/g.95930  ORF Transcript_39713/g.95930 Transcript_39713/m.95930 type:complete len:649 (+) Transcript_39713:190-2136(+)|eukprot:CAMPEP_0113630248 /NCGR_PEP_ID=MMETSP0017_2-20120614/15713_1 /TAXON_ID=2856 /ORGANISM="Cylindrotheca closterium" /LENGTH=648 /DNA_ID=CAMNT_0000540699 /DNA_START=67 /DNA_END=2013 /DNA_ORIENTATION=+ /assembly_acc=CAM_ASM_000147
MEIILHDQVKELGNEVFDQCEKLQNVAIPAVGRIKKCSFYNCRALTQVSLPAEGLKAIEDYAFTNCSSLSHITITSTVHSIGRHAFKGCSSLVEISLPSGLKEVSDFSFEKCISLRTVLSATSLQVIGQHAFRECSSLVDLDLPEGLKTIQEFAFKLCTSLQAVILPSTVETIARGAFESCHSMIAIAVPNGMKVIGPSAFGYCRSLQECDLPPSVAFLSPNCFEQCLALEIVHLHEGLKRIFSGAFASCSSLEFISVPSTVKNIDCLAFLKCTALVDISIKGDLDKVDRCVLDRCESLRTLSLPPRVVCIQTDACHQCVALVDIIFPERLRTIYQQAFLACTSLRAVAIPSNVTSLGSLAFKGCISLVSVLYFPISHRVYIGRSVFKGCKSLCNVHFNLAALNTIKFAVFDECDTLEKQFGRQVTIVDLRRRFEELHIHEHCSEASINDQISVEKITAELETWNRLDGTVDEFGMTLFHILASAPKLRIDLFQCLLDKLGSHVISLKDKQGHRAMDYLLMHELQDATPLIKGILRRTVLDRLSSWGTEGLREVYAMSIDLINFHLGSSDTRVKVKAIYSQMKLIETKEGITVLELALWKSRIQALKASPKRPRIDRISCLANCGSNVLIPMAFSFLGNSSGIKSEYE